MWVSAESARSPAQVKNSQSGIPFAIGVKDGARERGGPLRECPTKWWNCYINIRVFQFARQTLI